MNDILIRETTISDYPEILRICREVYPDSPVWAEAQIQSHISVFPEGQLVAEDQSTGKLAGVCASLIVKWQDYSFDTNWRDFTAGGFFTNHNPTEGRTLYAAEIMVAPEMQSKGVGSLFYSAREDLVRKLGLLRIRAGARLRGYSKHADRLSPEDYAIQVAKENIFDPTLSFQLKRDFHILAIVQGYLKNDPESLGYAAVIEWINEAVAKPEDYMHRDPRFG